MDSEEQAVPVLLNVLSDILLIKVNLSNNFFECIRTLLKLFDLSFVSFSLELYPAHRLVLPELKYLSIHLQFHILHASW